MNFYRAGGILCLLPATYRLLYRLFSGRVFFRVLPMAGCICLMLFGLPDARSQSPERQEAALLNKPERIERNSIPYYVRVKNVDHLRDQILHFSPNANLEKYPLFEYKTITEHITPLEINSAIPEDIWNLPIRIVNDTNGRDSVTLRELAKNKILVLDFWATWCKPCLASMDKWKDLHPKYADIVEVVGLMMDYDYKAELTISQKGWHMPQLIGPEVYLLNSYFCGTPVTGPSAWILDGRFIGASKTTADKEELVELISSGQIGSLPEHYLWDSIKE